MTTPPRFVSRPCRSASSGVGGRSFGLLLGCFALALAGGVGCKRSATAPPPGGADAGTSSVAVVTSVVKARPVAQYLPLTGHLKSGRETDLAANANGRVTQTFAERGVKVKAGEVLAMLDVRAAALSASEAKANADTAAANAANAKLECDRVDALLASGAIGKAEHDRVSTQCRTSSSAAHAAEARSLLAAQNVGDGAIRAPFAGVVSERYVDVGEYVRSDSKVVTLVDLSALRLQVTVPETNIAMLRPGAKVSFSVAGYPDKAFGATLRFIGAAVRDSTRDVVVEATVDEAGAEVLRPGMFASVRLETGERPTPVVPKTAIATRDGRTTAYVVVDGRVEQRIVQTTEALGDDVAVIRGIAEGEHLVVSPNDALKNGQRVSNGPSQPGLGG